MSGAVVQESLFIPAAQVILMSILVCKLHYACPQSNFQPNLLCADWCEEIFFKTERFIAFECPRLEQKWEKEKQQI